MSYQLGATVRNRNVLFHSLHYVENKQLFGKTVFINPYNGALQSFERLQSLSLVFLPMQFSSERLFSASSIVDSDL